MNLLLIGVQFSLQLSYILRTLLILLLKHSLDPLHLLLVGICSQLQVLIHVVYGYQSSINAKIEEVDNHTIS